MKDIDIKRLGRIIDKYNCQERFLIQLLLDVQNEFRWIPEEALHRVSKRLKTPMSQVYRVASFYKAMSLNPVGKHTIHVCMGTACQVRGAQKVLERVESKLCVGQGETTPDSSFTLNRVNCLGCCAIGPVVVVDDDYHGHVAYETADDIVERYS